MWWGQLAQRPAHAKSPAFDSWRSLLKANGMPALALGGGRAVDDESLEKVRSKMWGNAFRKAREGREAKAREAAGGS